MKVERKNNEILVRFSPGTSASKIQDILEYLRYEELTANTEATEEDVEDLTQKAKQGRWERNANKLNKHE